MDNPIRFIDPDGNSVNNPYAIDVNSMTFGEAARNQMVNEAIANYNTPNTNKVDSYTLSVTDKDNFGNHRETYQNSDPKQGGFSVSFNKEGNCAGMNIWDDKSNAKLSVEYEFNNNNSAGGEQEGYWHNLYSIPLVGPALECGDQMQMGNYSAAIAALGFAAIDIGTWGEGTAERAATEATIKTVQLTAKARTAEQGLEIGQKFLGKGYKEIAPGVFRSADELRQFRMTTGDILGSHGKIGPHFNFEIFNPSNLNKAVTNYHMPLKYP